MSEHVVSLHHLDLEQIPNQVGHAVLNSADGSIIKPPNGSLSMMDIDIMKNILLEMGHVLSGTDKMEMMKRVNIQGSNGMCYTMGVSKDGLVYIVKKSI
jgi:hypothetical protein